jgi:hypothetical protein
MSVLRVRVRGPGQWTGRGNDLAARFGGDGAHAEWFYGFRLAVRTGLGCRARLWPLASRRSQVPASPLLPGR